MPDNGISVCVSPWVADIAALVSDFYHVPVKELQGLSRRRSVAIPRQVLMYLARKYTRLSLEEIGTWLGFRDHSTVLHGVRVVGTAIAEKWKPENAKLAIELDWLIRELDGVHVASELTEGAA